MNTARLQRDKRRRWKSIRADLKIVFGVLALSTWLGMLFLGVHLVHNWRL